jgi:two-component system, OmpR family, alkaline phosphatase synthesis response regulator PhoP
MPAKIVIVDDEMHIRALIEQTLEELEDEGVTILTAANGQAGLQLIEREKPNLVFLDVMMPRMNGFEVCKSVKSNRKLDGTYIIMLTAKGQEFDRQKGEEVGADMYMTKPFNPDALLDNAREILGL